MGIFEDMLKSNETLFRDPIALDFDFLPKLLPFRENEQQRFAQSIKPLLLGRNGRNLFSFGGPGIGKTAACKHVLRELEEQTSDVIPLYLNCWKQNTTFKILVEICNQMGINFISNRKSVEIFEILKKQLNKKACVIVFDEVDKLESLDFLYMFLEDIYRKSIILITNYKEKVTELDERILSRLNPEHLEFKPYTKQETIKILKDRLKYAFMQDVWSEQAFFTVGEIAADKKDIRKGLYLLREAGNLAEERASKKIELKHVELALKKMTGFSKVNLNDFDSETQKILDLIKEKSGQRIGQIYESYLSQTKESIAYKTFVRKVDTLKKSNLIETKKSNDGKGNTTILQYINQ